jgi:HSP20 family molecular chaperone IbpA
MNAVTQTQAGTPARTDSPRREDALLPPVDVIEDPTGITLYADLPGVPRDKLAVRVEGDQLSIEGEVALAVPQGLESQHAEVRSSHYRRAFTLSKELDGEKIDAELSQGVLRVRIPKAGHLHPRKIEVRAA